MTLAALQGLHVVVSLSFVARRSTCFFATISERSDEDKQSIWLCPYWATASLLTMLSVAHIFSCLHNQCSRSFSFIFGSFVWPMTLAALQGLHVVVSLSFVARRSTCFFATISETSDEDKQSIWLCPYWATASVLTMFSVAHIFSCLHNQCSRSILFIFGSFVWPMTLAALQGLHVVVSLSFVARRSTCFFATISEKSDEDKQSIWLCPYWATASLLTMLSVAHIFSCLHNQCSRSFSFIFSSFVWPMTLAALQGLHVVVSLSFVARRSTCFFATISERSDEDKQSIWLCPYWATASLLTMLSVAHIFSCLHNQCSRSFSFISVL